MSDNDKDIASRKVSISVIGNRVSRDDAIIDSLYKEINSVKSSTYTVVVDRSSPDEVIFSGIDISDFPVVLDALDRAVGNLSDEDLVVSSANLSKEFGKKVNAADNLPDKENWIKITPKTGYEVSIDQHRFISSLCARYGGEKDKVSVGRFERDCQNKNGFFVRNIPEENINSFLNVLRSRLPEYITLQSNTVLSRRDISSNRASMSSKDTSVELDHS